MTPRYVARSWDVPPDTAGNAVGAATAGVLALLLWRPGRPRSGIGT